MIIIRCSSSINSSSRSRTSSIRWQLRRDVPVAGASAVDSDTTRWHFVLVAARGVKQQMDLEFFRGSPLNNTTCLTHVFFKSGE